MQGYSESTAHQTVNQTGFCRKSPIQKTLCTGHPITFGIGYLILGNLSSYLKIVWQSLKWPVQTFFFFDHWFPNTAYRHSIETYNAALSYTADRDIYKDYGNGYWHRKMV